MPGTTKWFPLSGLDSLDSPHVIPSNLKGKVCLKPCNPDIFNLHYIPSLELAERWNQIKPNSHHVYSGWFTQSNVDGRLKMRI